MFFLFSAMNAGTISQMFPTTPGLDQDLGNVGILLEAERDNKEEMEYSEFYSPSTGKLYGFGKFLSVYKKNSAV